MSTGLWKKSKKKLELNRETVKALGPRQLAAVNGGLTSSVGKTDACPSATCMCFTDSEDSYCGC